MTNVLYGLLALVLIMLGYGVYIVLSLIKAIRGEDVESG